MATYINNYKGILALFSFAIGVMIIFNPGLFSPIFFMILAACIFAGLLMLYNTWFIKEGITKSYPIFTTILAIALIIGSVYVFFFQKDNIGLTGILIGFLSIVMSLERVNAYNKYKGTGKSLAPILFAMFYWGFAVYLVYSMGISETTEMIRLFGGFFLCMGSFTLFSVYYLKDH